MHEKTGKMKQIVLDFLNDKKLSQDDLNILKKYIIQWIQATSITSPPNYEARIKQFNEEQLHEFILELLDYGIDPF